MRDSSYKPSLHVLAILTAAATFPLIFMGGLVTSHGAGMAVPDWPTTFDQNMFLYPPSLWTGGVFYEHTHRLLGSLVGFLAIALAVWTWIVDSRRWVRWLSLGVLAAVIVQGVLGGLRVIWVDLDLAVVHGMFGQAFFCLAGLVAVVTSKFWYTAPDLSADPAAPKGRRLVIFAAVAVILIYMQLIVGAIMRHYMAGLAIPDFPLSYGRWLPPMSPEQLEQANVYRLQIGLPPVSLAQVHIHFLHRVMAVIVTAIVLDVALRTVLRHWQQPKLRRLGILLGELVIVQVTLGAMTVLMRRQPEVASAHVAVGALLLLTAFVLMVRAMRLYQSSGSAAVAAPVQPMTA